jgi:hypothetical protein
MSSTLTALRLDANCTSYYCQHPAAAALGWIILFSYEGLAIWTSVIAKRSQRSQFIWLLYGQLVPILSFLHIRLLTWRSSRSVADRSR